MSRPKPKIIMEYVDDENHRNEQILEGEAIYVVYYDGKAFNLRTIDTWHPQLPEPKYKRVSFTNIGSAFGLKRRLNKLFDTELFQVYKLTGAELVSQK